MSDSLWPVDYSMPGFPVLHCLLEFAQTHVHWVGDGIQPSHPLMPPCPHAFNLSSIRVFSNELALCIRWQNIGASASFFPMYIQGWFPLGLTGLISLLSEGLSEVFCSTTVPKHQFFSAQPFLCSSSTHPYMTTGKTIASAIQTFGGKVMPLLF